MTQILKSGVFAKRRLMRLGMAGLVCLFEALGVGRMPKAQGSPAPPVAAPMIPAAPPPQASGYTVTGRVLCADTQRPARFAQVMLLPATQEEGGGFGRGRRLNARTDLDGNFTMNGVEAGDYYVTGQMTGYINQTSQVEQVLSAGGDTSSALSGIPEVHVSAGGASTQLTLQRGGVIAGTVTWDDGSPASGVQVSAQPAPTTTASANTSGSASQLQAGGARLGLGGAAFGFIGFGGSMTDDQGRFRVSGLAPGVYVLRASVQAPAPQQGDRGFTRTLNLAVYAPDKMRRAEAATITLAAGEEHDDVGVTLGLSALHSVSGVVSSTSAAVRSGSVSLTDQTDSSLNRMGVINPDGSFVVPYVPAGNYTLRVMASANVGYGFGRGGGSGSSSSSTVRFQPLQESVTVVDSDLTGLSLNVTPSTTSSQ